MGLKLKKHLLGFHTILFANEIPVGIFLDLGFRIKELKPTLPGAGVGNDKNNNKAVKCVTWRGAV